ncbi:MAG TPA: ZIP family metal transporter [Candidatus Moranbacteria bacterium]|nr:ZIP family metal transporter [Candidatus Moranbacteria bacterium]
MDTQTLLYTLAAAAAIAAASLFGALAWPWRGLLLRRRTFVLVSLAVGALLGNVFLHLLPEIYGERPGLGPWLIIVGVIFFFLVEKFLHWHHHEEKDCCGRHSFGKIILFSDGVHNFIDGAAVAAAFFVSPEVGLATAAAIIAHEIPQEMGDFAVLLSAGYGPGRALWLNFLSSLTVFGGVLAVWLLGEEGGEYVAWLLPLAAGGFVYVAMSDLLPALRGRRNLFLQTVLIAVGVLLVALI